MKVNFNVPLTDSFGKIVNERPDAPIFLKNTVVMALVAPQQEYSPEQKYRLAKLADRVAAEDGAVQVSIEEAKMIKDAVGQMGAPIVVARVFDLMEGDDCDGAS